MGVPRLFPWLVRKFPSRVLSFTQGEQIMKNFSHLYLDANGLLHGAAQQVFNYGAAKNFLNPFVNLTFEEKKEQVFQIFFEHLIEICYMIRPTKTVYIAIDGPAPLAKQAQQRQRRFVASMNRKKEQEETTDQTLFDSNSITPGTELMHELTQYIYFAIRNEMTNSYLLKDVAVIFSPVTVPGEGEHKIMDYIRQTKAETRKDKHCFFGPDGDLIMLTLATNLERMYLFRENIRDQGGYDLLDMGGVRNDLLNVIYLEDHMIRSFDDSTFDFIVQGFFVGNDFLPKIQMFEFLEDGLEKSIEAYHQSSHGGKTNFITENGKVKLRGFCKFVAKLASHERELLINQVVNQDKRRDEEDEKFKNKTLAECIQQDNKGRLFFDYLHYRHRYYTEKCKFSVSEMNQKIQELCHDYLKTFIWVFEYYVSGNQSWDWAFRFHYPPLMEDFAYYLTTLTQTDFDEIYTFEMGTPTVPFVQLLGVLPRSSSYLLPPSYQKLMTDKDSPLAKYYPEEFEIDYEGKAKEYQGVALLPFVHQPDIQKAYLQMKNCCVDDNLSYHRNELSKTPVLFLNNPVKMFNFTSKFGTVERTNVEKIVLRDKE